MTTTELGLRLLTADVVLREHRDTCAICQRNPVFCKEVKRLEDSTRIDNAMQKAGR